MPSKKNKNDPKQTEPPKPLGHYVKDRLELTRQLFSCLKSKQVKSRLPQNLQNKSMERIQQLCLDEILGISSKRLLSIINNTKCPLDTESDSDIEHISLSEISSSSDLEFEPVPTTSNKQKKLPAEQSTKEISAEKESTTNLPQKKPGAKEMTMLELLELQARARAIRSQLALEPVTKIELDSDEEEEGAGDKEAVAEKDNPSASTASKKVAAKSDDKRKEKTPTEKAKKSSSKEAHGEKSKEAEISLPVQPKPRRIVIIKSPEKALKETEKPREKAPPQEKTTRAHAPPIKLKRNFSATGDVQKKVKTPSPTKEKKEPVEDLNASRTSSPDVITMEQNIATYFISDSDEDNESAEPPAKKAASPKIVVKSIEIIPPLNVQEEPVAIEVAEEVVPKMTAGEEEQDAGQKPSQASKTPSENEDDDENVVNIMSDTELNVNSDKEEEEGPKQQQKQVETKKIENTQLKEKETATAPAESQPEPEPQTSQSENFNDDDDDDVVEIPHSPDELLDSDKPDDSEKNSDESETWAQRYLRSSSVKTVLKTTKLATKVREKIAQNQRTLRTSRKKAENKEKEMKEKMSTMEEGSMKQFEVLKESKSKD